MQLLEQLEDLAFDAGVFYNCYPTSGNSFVIELRKNIYFIALDESLFANKKQLGMYLGHELGHILLGRMSNTSADAGKNERKVWQWLVNKFVCFEDLYNGIKSTANNYELANELEISQKLLEIAIQIYEPQIIARNYKELQLRRSHEWQQDELMV